ncbi:MAG: hypothetical protein SNJ58_04205 [Aggregatilineales bacterium]
MQGNHRLHAAIVQRNQHLAVAPDGSVVELPLPRLDAAPGDRDALGIVAHGCSAIEILEEAPTPPLAGSAAALILVDAALALLPLRPIIHRIALNLMGCCSTAP